MYLIAGIDRPVAEEPEPVVAEPEPETRSGCGCTTSAAPGLFGFWGLVRR